MTARWSIVAFSLALSACHGIEHPTAPAPVSTQGAAPTEIQIAMLPAELPIGGGTVEVRIATTAGRGSIVAPHVRVQLTADSGSLAAAEITTDATGHATTSWSGTASAMLTASAGALTQTTPLVVRTPTVFPPSPGPPPPAPVPTPDPLPTPTPTPTPLPDPVVVVTLVASPSSVGLNQDVTLHAIASSNLSAGVVTTYRWDTDANGTIDQTTATDTITVQYRTVGPKQIVAYANTANGTTGRGLANVAVTAPALAVALSVSPATAQATGTMLMFTATPSASSGTVPSGLVYDWDFNNDGVPEIVGGSSTPPAQTYSTSGSKTIRATARSPDGRTATNTITITVS